MTFAALITPWVLFTLSLVCSLVTQRWLQRHMIGLGLLATGKPDAAVTLYHTVTFPGVLLHELSHWLAARLLLVRTGRFVIWPERDKRGVRLGYIEVEKPDPLRGALIGAAPVVVGLLALLGIADKALNLGDLAAALPSADLAVIRPAVERLARAPDFWVWLYLIFAIANTMMPSPEDRQSWPAFIAGVAVVALFMLAAGFGGMLLNALAGPVTAALNLLAGLFAVVFALNLGVMALVWAAEFVGTRATGRRVDYAPPPKPAATADAAAPPRRPRSIYERPLPVPAPPRNAPPVEPEGPHPPAPALDEPDDAEMADLW